MKTLLDIEDELCAHVMGCEPCMKAVQTKDASNDNIKSMCSRGRAMMILWDVVKARAIKAARARGDLPKSA